MSLTQKRGPRVAPWSGSNKEERVLFNLVTISQFT